MRSPTFQIAILVMLVLLLATDGSKSALAQDAKAARKSASKSSPSSTSSGRLPADVRRLESVLEPIRLQYNLPALAAAVVNQNRLAAIGAVGVRRANGNEPVTVDDLFHIGSCTKAMTATLCAILVQKGKLKAGATIGEAFADQRNQIRPEYHQVTLQQLLSHRSGLPEDRAPDPVIQQKIWALRGPMIGQRRKFVELVLSQPPAAPPGTQFQYSNAGYVLAGAMCERATGKAWEVLIREYLCAPLGMTTVGFGMPGSANTVDQPWGHREAAGGTGWVPVAPGLQADNPAVLGPAGTLHCSLADWGKFASLHLRGEKGDDKILPAGAFRFLHTPPAGEYAFGWLAVDRDWAGGKALSHSGSNKIALALIWLAPKRGIGYLATTNVGGDVAQKACDAAITKLIQTGNERRHP
jgi:CubicO group peptidase (beta-lactamase class C family)